MKKIRLTALITSAILILNILNCISVSAQDGYINIGGTSVPVHVIQKSGNDNENFVILFLGDGYTKSEQDMFIKDITVLTGTLLAKEPFRSSSDKINIYAVPTVSAESGVSDAYSTKNTYYGITHYARRTFFGQGGEEKAREIKTAIENTYLDKGACVGTIHVLSNSDDYFGSSSSALFSYASKPELYKGGEASIHEIAHSIGKLKDEYGEVPDSENTSTGGKTEDVAWKQFLGFSGVGITLNGNHGSSYIPTLSCIMKSIDNYNFCEVCKSELVRRMNSSMYTQVSKDYYIAVPDVTIEHNNKYPIGNEYEKYRINERNIINANGQNLELRTVVQNLKNKEQHLILSLKITDKNGAVKLFKEQAFTIPPLSNEYNFDPARKSLSVVIEDVDGLCYGDKIFGTVTDADTQSVVASIKSNMTKININHKIKDENGNVSAIPKTSQTTVYVPTEYGYCPKTPKQLNGYVYVGNSLKNQKINLTGKNVDVDFYYRKENGIKETKTYISGKTFTVKPRNIPGNTRIILALYDGSVLNEIKSFVYNGDDITYTTNINFTHATVMAWENLNGISPVCNAEKVKAN